MSDAIDKFVREWRKSWKPRETPKRPTIAELEELLARDEAHREDICINPDGSLEVMPPEWQVEMLSAMLRAALADPTCNEALARPSKMQFNEAIAGWDTARSRAEIAEAALAEAKQEIDRLGVFERTVKHYEDLQNEAETALKQIRALCEPDSYGVLDADAVVESVKQVCDAAMKKEEGECQGS